jgi:hypothetical protein
MNVLQQPNNVGRPIMENVALDRQGEDVGVTQSRNVRNGQFERGSNRWSAHWDSSLTEATLSTFNIRP